MLFARHNRVHDCVCVGIFMKKSFSQSVSEAEFLLSIYNISTDQSKDDYHLETAGDYVLNTLLVFIRLLLSGGFITKDTARVPDRHSCLLKCHANPILLLTKMYIIIVI